MRDVIGRDDNIYIPIRDTLTECLTILVLSFIDKRMVDPGTKTQTQRLMCLSKREHFSSNLAHITWNVHQLSNQALMDYNALSYLQRLAQRWPAWADIQSCYIQHNGS